jgi:MFS family permease
MDSPISGPALASERRVGFFPTVGGKWFALAVLFSMNLLNYVDRYAFFAVGPQVQEHLRISNLRLGVLNSAFMIVYTLVLPVVGWMGDRYDRRRLLAFGVGLWSVATVGTAFAQTFHEMFFWRGLLGVGEASYGVIAPALLADLFPARQRGRVMGLYQLALVVGGALGYGIGGSVAYHWGWRATFWVVGLPGLLAAASALIIHDPGRGASDGKLAGMADRPRLREYLELFKTPTFLLNTAGMAGVTFATGGFAAWGSSFYQRVRGLNAEQAGVWIGGLTAAAGLLGIALGTFVADWLLRFTRRAYLLMASVVVLLAVPFGMLGILDPDPWSSLGCLAVAMVLLSMVLGPCNAVTANVVPANRRATGYAAHIFLIHLLGDISSPILIAALADRFGKPAVVQSWLGRMVWALGGGPVRMPDGHMSNLVVGMLAVIPVMALGSFFFLIGSRHLELDQQRAQAGAAKAHGSGGEWTDGF